MNANDWVQQRPGRALCLSILWFLCFEEHSSRASAGGISILLGVFSVFSAIY